MSDEPDPIAFDAPVLLLGGGPAPSGLLEALLPRCGAVVAADGGANRLRADGPRPRAVIGDMDSIDDLSGWREESGVDVLEVTEQDSTDLEKCLRLTRAPLYLGVGFLDGRLDHTLASLHALLAFADRRVVLLGEADAAFIAPRRWRAELEPGARVSIFPVAPCIGLASEGLAWPLAGLPLSAGETIGTSNRATQAAVGAEFDRAGAAILLERRFLDAAIASLAD